MDFRSKLFRLTIGFGLVLSLSLVAFADTIRLKDGSIIKGKITTFGSGKFTVSIGEGTRQRQMSFDSDEIESIQFDSNATMATTKADDQNKYSIPDNKVITVSQAPKAPDVVKPTVQNNPVPDNSNSKAIEVDVKVLADNTANGWTNTGWVVKKGQRIRIVGDGRVSLGNGRFATAAGISSLSDNEKLLKNVATGALIAVIGDDNNEFIFVGANSEFTASRDGALFLGINEGNLEDNSGAFDVKIEIGLDTE